MPEVITGDVRSHRQGYRPVDGSGVVIFGL